jgi:hypothetical protein
MGRQRDEAVLILKEQVRDQKEINSRERSEYKRAIDLLLYEKSGKTLGQGESREERGESRVSDGVEALFNDAGEFSLEQQFDGKR